MTDEPKGLKKPRVYRERQEALRLQAEWDGLSEGEREVRLLAMWSHQQDERYLKARVKMIALIDDGRFQQAITDAVDFMSKRGMRELKRRAKLDGKEGRHARWLLVLLARASAEVQGRQVVLGPPIKVKTRFARDGEKTFGSHVDDNEPRPKITTRYAQPVGADDEEE